MYQVGLQGSNIIDPNAMPQTQQSTAVYSSLQQGIDWLAKKSPWWTQVSCCRCGLKCSFSFSFLNPCLSHTGLGFWLIVEKFSDLSRIRGKFDCRILQFFVGHCLHEMTTGTHSKTLLFSHSFAHCQQVLKGRYTHACNLAKHAISSTKGTFSVQFWQFFVGTFLTTYLKAGFSPFPSIFHSDPFSVVSRRFLLRSGKRIACPHESLRVFWPRTTMVVDWG